MATSAEYRARARAQLGNQIFSNTWIMGVVLVLIVSIVMGVGSTVVVGGFLLEGILLSGLIHALLSVVRGKKDTVAVEDLLWGRAYIGDLFLLSLMKNIFLVLWLLIPIVGFVKYYSYAMTYYIKHDHPEYDWRTCITESRRMMDGYKWRLFCLELSFLGWMIVGALCFGIGTLWVQAYMRTAEANFYEDLKVIRATEG